MLPVHGQLMLGRLRSSYWREKQAQILVQMREEQNLGEQSTLPPPHE
jgi:hypothetical protein